MNNPKNENNTYDLTVEKTILKSPAEVFRAIGEGRLFLNCSAGTETLKVDFRVGGKYHIDFVSYGMSNNGEFLEIVPNEKIVFTWCQDPMASDKPDTTVTIQLKEQKGNTLLTLKHVGFKNEDRMKDHLGGWSGGLEDMGAEITQGRLRFNRYFKIPVQKLYDTCKNPASFFGLMGDVQKGSVDFKVGGKFKVPTQKGEVTGEFLEITPMKKIVFTWKSTGCGTPFKQDSKVTLSFDDDDENDSWLELIHEGLETEDQQKTHRAGWDHIMTKIAL